MRAGIVGVGFMSWIHYLAYQRSEIAEMAATRQINPLYIFSLECGLLDAKIRTGENLQRNNKPQIKIPPKERYTPQIQQQRTHKTNNHDRVPRRNLKRDHRQLI